MFHDRLECEIHNVCSDFGCKHRRIRFHDRLECTIYNVSKRTYAGYCYIDYDIEFERRSYGFKHINIIVDSIHFFWVNNFGEDAEFVFSSKLKDFCEWEVRTTFDASDSISIKKVHANLRDKIIEITV